MGKLTSQKMSFDSEKNYNIKKTIHVIIFLLQGENELGKAGINYTQDGVIPLGDDVSTNPQLLLSLFPNPSHSTYYRLLWCSTVKFLISSSLHPSYFFLLFLFPYLLACNTTKEPISLQQSLRQPFPIVGKLFIQMFFDSCCHFFKIHHILFPLQFPDTESAKTEKWMLSSRMRIHQMV